MSLVGRGSVATILCLVEVAEVFRELADWLRHLDGVSRVMQPSRMTSIRRLDSGSVEYGKGDGVGIDWYADAEFFDGRAISFGLELSWDAGEWVIEPAIRVNNQNGQDDLIEIAERFATEDSEMFRELVGAARLLASYRDEALRLFRPDLP